MTEIPEWGARSSLPAAIQNPALIAATIAYAAARHRTASRTAMPWELAFLVPPLVLTRETREALPKTSHTHLPTWVNDNQLVLAGWPPRARKFVPHVREGLRVGLRSGLLKINDGSRLRASIPSAFDPEEESELIEILRASAVLGGIFAKTGPPASTFTLLGVSP